jgi:hypothetical protein
VVRVFALAFKRFTLFRAARRACWFFFRSSTNFFCSIFNFSICAAIVICSAMAAAGSRAAQSCRHRCWAKARNRHWTNAAPRSTGELQQARHYN